MLAILIYHAFFFFFLAFDLKFLIPEIIVQISNPAAELAAGISTEEAKPEMETRPVNVEGKID